MTTNRSRAGGPSARWAGGGLGRRLRVCLAFLGFLAVGLSQVGCQSDGCSTCGGFGSRLRSNVQALNARLFNHEGRGGCSTCGALGTESGVILDQGVPITSGAVVTPGVISTPGVVPVPAPAAVGPATGDDAGQLVPIPSPTSGAHAAPTSSLVPAATTGGTTRSAYDTTASRGSNVVLSRRSTPPSRIDAADAPRRAGYTTDEPDITSQLPPVDLPIELTRRANSTDITEPASSSPSLSPGPGDGGPAESLPTTSAIIQPAAAPAPTPTPTPTPGSTTAAEPRSAGVSGGVGAGAGSGSGGVVVQATPGIARSAPVAPTVLGGSLPSSEGLEWLGSKGYRTLVDLRASGEADPTFAERVSDNGMLYVALPFGVDSLRANRLTHFNDLINQADQHPLYFCDSDGRRAGLLWYLHLRSSSDREEQSSARAKAEEVGFKAALDQARAEEFLKGNFPALASPPSRKADATTPTGSVRNDPPVALTLDIAPPSVSQILDPDPPALPLDEPILPSRTPLAATVISGLPTVPLTPPVAVALTTASTGPQAPPAASPPPRRSPFDRNAQPPSVPFDRVASWKPVATLVLSGLGVPLAYWSRIALFPRRGPRRASLTAKGPGPRKALPASDA